MDSIAQDTDLKSRKEAFVSGHKGSPHPWEVLWVCSSAIWGCWLYAEIVLSRTSKKATKFQTIHAEVLLVWLPVILAQTDYLYPYASLWMVGQIAASVVFFRKRKIQEEETKHSSCEDQEKESNNDEIVSLTLYRSTIYFLTFVAILAVDFPLFPRRFCKTEVAGYGLMDVGAASFVISGGIVNGRAYAKATSSSSSSSSKKNQQPLWKSLLKPLVKAAPLIAIGIIRCITNKELEYQEHVTEYGVHWNFFFTLGVLAVVPTLRRQLLVWDKLPEFLERWIFWAPVVAMSLYEYELVFGRGKPNGLESFILAAPRTPSSESMIDSSASFEDRLKVVWTRFFFANREGILGCIGYIFLFVTGEWVGQHYVFGSHNGVFPLLKLVVYSWIALYSVNIIFNNVPSRRETNLSFCLWALSHNLTILWGFLVVERCTRQTAQNNCNGGATIVPPSFRAVNKHGMASFLVANLLTGLINLLVPTIDTGDGLAMIILAMYLSAVGGVALLLDTIGIGGGRGTTKGYGDGIQPTTAKVETEDEQLDKKKIN